MSASPKFAPVQHFEQNNTAFVTNDRSSIKMTSPERKKDLIMSREVENGIHIDTARYNGGEKSAGEDERKDAYCKVMYNADRYNMKDMKVKNIGETFSADRFNKREYNLNHSIAETDETKHRGDELIENSNERKEHPKCSDDMENLANGKSSLNDKSSMKNSPETAERDSSNNNVLATEKNTSNGNKDSIIKPIKDSNCIDLENEEGVPISDLEASIIDNSAEESKATRIGRQLNKIELLKEDLRCEEATLNILRKLIDSQRGKNGYKASAKHQGSMSNLHSKQPPQIAPKVAATPKQQSFQQGKNIPPPANQPPVQKYYIQVGNQLVPAPPPGTPGSGPIYQYANGATSSPHSSYQPSAPTKPPPPPKQTPEQKQNAAKAALRRQLEQTLLQIPPPRPPPADWRAIPNVNSMDFMMLVGLDEVVDNILDMDMKPTLKNALDELIPYNPRICSQCRVDFSPCWKNKDGNSKDFVLCERCALQNVKKELKAEHTSRLKSAFLKALKQEQEIEEKIKAGEDVNIGNITGAEKNENVPSPITNSQSQNARISSPKSAVTVPVQPSSNHVPNSTERHHQSPTGHHHRHQVVQHYPHHSPLVQQLHHQHIQQQQQQIELDPPPQRHSSRWHPYLPPPSSHHHRDHHPSHHRSYVPVSSSASVEGNPHQEYYVVHHPQHAGVRYINR